MQYQEYHEGVYVEYSDGIDKYREGVRNLLFVTDKTLTPIGFNGFINIDWVNLNARTKIGITGVYRDGTRDGKFVLDETMNGTGFTGSESTDGGITGDWINMETIPI